MKIIFPKIRLAFPQLWESKAFEAGGKEKFSATLLFADGSSDHKLVKNAVSTILQEAHGEKAPAKFKAYSAAGHVWVLRDGDAKPQYSGFPGMLYLGASSERRPKVRNADGITDLAPSDGKPYAGAYVRAIIDVYEYKAAGGGITAELLGIQFVEDGERLSGGGVAEEDDFEAIPEAANSDMEDTTGAPAEGAAGIFD